MHACFHHIWSLTKTEIHSDECMHVVKQRQRTHTGEWTQRAIERARERNE